MNENLWNGTRVSDSEFKRCIEAQFNNPMFWAKSPLNHYVLFETIKKTQAELLLKKEFYLTLVQDLKQRVDISNDEVDASIEGLINFLNVDQLRLKLKRELGSENPFELRRSSAKENQFEAWYPLGTLVHVTPNNSPLLGVLSVIEGLLSGNVNILKLARKDSAFAALFFEEMCRLDTTETIKDYIYVAKISSKEKDYLKKILSLGNVISAWGSEESVQSIRELAPRGARIVEWGHKISFSFITK